MYTKLKQATILCLLYAQCSATAGLLVDTPKSYRVEVVVFSHITPEAFNQETWTPPPPLNKPAQTIELSNEDDAQSPNFRKIASEDFHLTKEADKLAKQPNTYILYHTAWIQPFYDGKITPSIDIDSERDANEMTPLQSHLFGYINIRLKHYFDIKANLHFVVPPDEFPVPIAKDNFSSHEIPNPLHFSLHHTQRTRANRLEYIDHPLMSMLVLIEKAPKDEQASS